MLTAMADEQQWQHSEAVGIPQQHDGVNCGVFALVFADCLSVGFPLSDCHLNGNFTEPRAHLAHALLQVSTHGAHGLGELVHLILETCATVGHLTTHCCLVADCRMHLSCCSSCWQPLTLLQWLLTEGLFMVIKVAVPACNARFLGVSVYDRIAAQPQATPAFSTVASILASPAQTDVMAKLGSPLAPIQQAAQQPA